jgi:hypothetical protein
MLHIFNPERRRAWCNQDAVEFTSANFATCTECIVASTGGLEVRDGTVGEVIDQRTAVYGPVEECFVRIAQIWSGVLGIEVNAHDVPLCMIGMKMVRTQYAPDYSDNTDDIDGYLDIFRTIIGDDMVHARTVTEYVELKAKRARVEHQAAHS